MYPDAAVGPDGVIYVVYHENRTSEDFNIYLAKSFDGGATFNDPAEHILVYDDGLSNAFQGQPAIDVDSDGTIHIVFVAGINYVLYYTYSTDGGATFSPIVNVTDAVPGTKGVAQYPTVVADALSGYVYVGWRDGRLTTMNGNGTSIPKAYYSVGKRTESGIDFSPNRCVYGDPNDKSMKQSTPAFALDKSGTLYIAWHDNRTEDLNIYYALTRDFGETLEYSGSIDDNSSSDSGSPALAIDSMGRIYAAYAVDDSPDGSIDDQFAAIALAICEPGSTSFGQYQNVTIPDGCLSPAIAILDGGNIFLMYTVNVQPSPNVTPYRGIFYISSLDGGLTWSSPIQVDAKKKEINNQHPALVCLDEGNVTLIWQENDRTLDVLDRNVRSYYFTELIPPRLQVEITPQMVERIPVFNVTFNVTVTSNSLPVDNCLIEFFSDSGGDFSPVSELGGGVYQVVFDVPDLPIGTKISIRTEVSKMGYPEAGTMSRVMIVQNQLPVPVINVSPAPPIEINHLLTLNGSDSYDYEGFIASYEWTFGDGTNASGIVVTHSWAAPGIFEVTLNVTDDLGASNIVFLNVTVVLPSLYLSLVMNRSYLPVGSTAKVTVYVFDDGTPIDGALINAYCEGEKTSNPTSVTPNQTYSNAAGIAYLILEAEVIDHAYTEILQVSASKEGYMYDTESLSFSVLVPPSAEFNYSANLTYVQFDASNSFDPDGFLISYNWNFGDGTTGSGITVDHTYSILQPYTVTLTVTDNHGANDVSEDIIYLGLLEIQITPTINPIPNEVNTDILVEVTCSGFPIEGANVSLSCDYRYTTIVPDYAFIGADGIAVFDFFGTCRRDTWLTLTAVVQVKGFSEHTEISYVLLNYPGLHASFYYENDTVPSRGSLEVLVTVTDDYGSLVSNAKVMIYTTLDGSGSDPLFGFTDQFGNFSFTYLAPLIGNETLTETVFFDISKTGYEYNNTANFALQIIPLPWLVATASTALSEYLWYDFIFIDATAILDGIPEEGVLMNARIVGGPGMIITTPLYTDLNGNVQFEYLSPLILKWKMVFVKISPELPGYIEGVDYLSIETVISFKVKASMVELQIFDYPLVVQPGDRVIVKVLVLDERSDPIPGLQVEFFFTTNISSDYMASTSNADGIASAFCSAPQTDVPIPMNVTVYSKTKGYLESTNWTTIVVDPEPPTNLEPVAIADATPSSALVGELITFDGSASYDPDGTIVSWEWDFGDTSTGSGEIITHSYSTAGNYGVILTVEDDYAAINCTSLSITVSDPITPPVADATASPNPAYIDEVVTFDSSGSYDLDGTIVSWEWDFGDGTTGSGEIVTHTYSSRKNYNVDLTVTDNDGLTDTITIQIRILQP